MSNEQTESRSRTAKAVQEIYRPILRGYFSVFAFYYLVMVPFNYSALSGLDMVKMVAASSLASIIGIFGGWYMRKPAEPRRVELLLIVMNVMVICNVVIALQIGFTSEKLTYFIILAMLFALASVNFRQSALSISLAILALSSFMHRLEAAEFSAFAFLTFGAAMASLAIAFFLRKSITKIADAKLHAENRLKNSRKVAAEMRQQSLSDSLTKMPNRRAFFSELHSHLREGKAASDPNAQQANIWLFLLDLDGFKSVNDIHGHLTGDLLLKKVAARLKAFSGEGLHCSRMGGDEFNIISVGPSSEQDVTAKAEQLLQSLAETYEIEGRHIKISCSIGLKKIDLEQSVRSQISQADYALMVSKKQGKNCITVFDEVHAKQAEARYLIEDALRQANLETEISLLFQPQYDLRSNSIACAEALARWDSPLIGEIEPQRFITIAEESGLITGITLVVVRKTFEALASWREPIPISINLSSYDLISDPTIEQISVLAEEYDINPSMIEFEVTETAMMADFEKATENLRKLAAIGYSIALDDFGTGYSNFNYLRALPITKLKVDRSFVENPGDPMTEKVLTSLAGMARTLGMHCLLEGVEDEVCLLMAKRAGAESVQGYYFGKPMSRESLRELIDDSYVSAA